jgi:hypothetical protein
VKLNWIRRALPFAALLLLVMPGALLRAQDTTRAARARTDSAGPVAVVIYAAASAREVHFNKQPEIRVRLSGGLDSVHVLERRNLPSPVVTGTTYRDVYVAVQIFGRLTADCLKQTLAGTTTMDCASLELRGTSNTVRPPADSGRPPRR